MGSPRHSSDDLNSPVQYVKGIGPRRAALLAKQGIRTVRDLLYYFPFDYLDLGSLQKIGRLREYAGSGKWVSVVGRVQAFDLVGRPPRQRFVLVLGDETGTIQLIFFRSIQFFQKAFAPGELLAVSGKVTSYRYRPQIVHPSIDRLSEGGEEGDEEDLQGFLHTKGLVPKYGSSEELKNVNLHVKGIRRLMKSAVAEFAPFLRETLPSPLQERYRFLPLGEAITQIHFPGSLALLEEARRRLKFDELFTMQLLLAIRRRLVKVEAPGIAYNVESALARRLVDSLPFRLTGSQSKVIREIAQDMQSPKPMNRLLQGDVGSGKTVVALLAMLVAVDNGYQAAFMAPTEILAEQHMRTLSSFLKDLPVRVRLLIGGQRMKLREDVLEDIRQGSAQIVVGTHALIQEQVNFAKLGFLVIDEQHRFGVLQRLALREKGMPGRELPDILVMTATPIPRTFSMTLYGDLDVSVITELPADRKVIQTHLKLDSQRDSVHEFLRQSVRAGAQAYIVYPLVEESEKLDLKAATESYENLKTRVFPDLSVGLVHGRMAGEEKDAVMEAFKAGRIQILVATTVIEVGIDVPNATVMVIEHAERFGLSQLHQLRGRVGRGRQQSHCMLVAPDWMGKLLKRSATAPALDGVELEEWRAVRRLKTIQDTTDGFKIAEIDLDIRGPGDFFGTRQSGLPALQIANLLSDGELLGLARTEAFTLVHEDPHLRRTEHAELRRHIEEKMKQVLALMEG